MKEGLFNRAMREYLRITGTEWLYWDSNEYEFCIHLMNQFGISVKSVTAATWYSECYHWGIGRGGNVMEAVFNCFLGYSSSIGDASI